jgi:hypothetical protein
MPATLTWGKKFAVRTTKLTSGEEYAEVYGIEGDCVPISWHSLSQLQHKSEAYGISWQMWPIYPDCDVDTDVPLGDVQEKAKHLYEALNRLAPDVVSSDYWLQFIFDLLREGHLFFVVP